MRLCNIIIYVSKTVAKVLVSLRDVAPVHPHYASSELLSKEANDAIDDKAVSQYECRSSSNDVSAQSELNLTSPVEPLMMIVSFFSMIPLKATLLLPFKILKLLLDGQLAQANHPIVFNIITKAFGEG